MIKKIKLFFISNLHILFFILIISFIFRNLILNINTSFIDWVDTPFVTWQTITTRDKLINLDFQNLYTTNSHYPYKNSLFFTDTFLGQSIMSIPLFFIKNPILLYNILFLITIFLNYLAAYLLFKKLLKTKLSGFIGSIFLNNSFYLFDQLIHLQTMTYWPMLFFIYYLFSLYEKHKFDFKALTLSAIMFSIQFYMSVYLGIFSLFVFGIFSFIYILDSLINLKFKSILHKVINLSLIAIIFFVLTYPVIIKNYLEFEKTYHTVRDMNEILNTSTHATDYLFFIKDTLISKLKPIEAFNKFNNHNPAEQVYFPGIILFFGFLGGFFINKIKFDKKNKRILFEQEINLIDIFFLILGIVGFVFSLGPRLNANGNYLEIPLPYLLFLNKLSFLYSIRLTHRWALLLILMLIYFSLKFYSKLKKPILIFIMALFVIESIPLNLKFTNKQYLDRGHEFLKNNGQKREVLMEFPFLNLEQGRGPDYETMNLLASTYHGLNLFNGYTGLFISEQGWIRLYMEKSFPDEQLDNILKNLNIKYIKVNKKYLTQERTDKIKNYYKNHLLYDDQSTLIIDNNPTINIDQNIAKNISVKFKKDGTMHYGLDKRFYLNLVYTNKLDKLITNLNQKKITLKLNFYNNNQLTYTKEYYDLYPLINFPKGDKLSTIAFAVKKSFNRIDFTMYNEKNQLIDHYSSSL